MINIKLLVLNSQITVRLICVINLQIYPTPQVEAGFFTKTAYKGGGFQEATRYLETQPIGNRKLGFMTKDAHKRDEFSNGVRTEQYRESIRKEKDIIDKGASHIQDQLAELMSKRASESSSMSATNTTDANGFSYDEKVPQYDIGRTRVTPFDPKSKGDTFYKFSHERGKRMGGYKPISTDTGDGAWSFQYKPPQHGGKSEVKNFFDKSHISVQN